MIALLAAITFASFTHADSEIDTAIPNVQKDMASPDFSKKAAQMSPAAKAATDRVKSLSGGDPALEREINTLSADVLGNMKGKSMEEIQEMLEAAKDNPEKFADSFTPEQKQKLKEIGEKLEKTKGSAKPH